MARNAERQVFDWNAGRAKSCANQSSQGAFSGTGCFPHPNLPAAVWSNASILTELQGSYIFGFFFFFFGRVGLFNRGEGRKDINDEIFSAVFPTSHSAEHFM